MLLFFSIFGTIKGQLGNPADDACLMPESKEDAIQQGYSPIGIYTNAGKEIFRKEQCFFKLRSKGYPHEHYHESLTEYNVLKYLHACGNFTDDEIPTCYGYKETSDRSMLVQKALVGVPFYKFVENVVADEQLNENDLIVTVLLSALDLLERLEHCDVSYRDLNSQNCLVDVPNERFRLIDFGWAVSPETPSRGELPSSPILGLHHPPDALLCGHSDIYSLGEMVKEAINMYKLRPSLGLNNFVYMTTRPDCTSREENIIKLRRVLLELGYVTNKIAVCNDEERIAPSYQLTTINDCFQVSGYQYFTICKKDGHPDGDDEHASPLWLSYMYSKAHALPEEVYGTVLDYGGGAGYFSYLLLKRGASAATVFDTNQNTLELGKQIASTFELSVNYTSTVAAVKSHDILIAFGIVPWLLLCNDEKDDPLQDIVTTFSELTNRYLYVEWFEPKATIYNKLNHQSKAYTTHEFYNALSKEFVIMKKHKTSIVHRVIYEAQKIVRSSPNSGLA